MSGHNGRALTIDWDGTTLVGVRSKTVSLTNELVDVTTDDDNGWVTRLAEPGLKSVEVSVSGITNDEVLVVEFFGTDPEARPAVANLPSNLSNDGTLNGSFLLQDLETSGEHDGAVEFSATFVSTGAVTHTAASA